MQRQHLNFRLHFQTICKSFTDSAGSDNNRELCFVCLSNQITILSMLSSYWMFTGALSLGYISGFAQVHTSHFPYWSAAVGDTFEIYVSYKGELDPTVKYNTVWYSDADIESGIQLREALAAEDSNASIAHTLFIGIGQRGDYHHVRRRDLVPPILDDSTVLEDENPLHRHADKYYQFLTKELMPLICERYAVNDRRTLIGHSFGGLFVMWCLFKQEHLFHNYIALSPSLWKNHRNIFDYEEAYSKQHRDLDAYLYLSGGSRETINGILPNIREMKSILEEHRYAGLTVDYAEHPGTTHASQVPVSLAYVMRHVQF